MERFRADTDIMAKRCEAGEKHEIAVNDVSRVVLPIRELHLFPVILLRLVLAAFAEVDPPREGRGMEIVFSTP
jgi:hypothetical protein